MDLGLTLSIIRHKQKIEEMDKIIENEKDQTAKIVLEQKRDALLVTQNKFKNLHDSLKEENKNKGKG